MDKDWYKPYDSPEELYVSWYLDELVEAGYVLKYDYQPTPYRLSPRGTYIWGKELKTKTKRTESTLLHEHIYTPDFKITWDGIARSIFVKNVDMFWRTIATPSDAYVCKETPFWVRNTSFMDGSFLESLQPLFESILEVKPLFDRNNMTRLFTINQKWVYDKYGVYVQKIIPQKLFKDTFTPMKYLLTDSGKQKRKLIFAPKTLEEYVESRKG